MAAAGLLRNGSRLVFMAIVGVSAARVALHAAVGVGMQLRLVSVLPALAFQVATATLVGQALGRGDFQEADAVWRRSALLLGAIAAVISAAMMLLAGPLTELFIASADAVDLGTKVLRWFAAAQFFSALSIALQGALMGAGDNTPALRYTVWGQWIVMVPLAYALTSVVGWEPDGALAAWAIAPAITLVLTWQRLRSGAWKAKRIVT
jgi:Na+-driven multidrug efflux pump